MGLLFEHASSPFSHGAWLLGGQAELGWGWAAVERNVALELILQQAVALGS